MRQRWTAAVLAITMTCAATGAAAAPAPAPAPVSEEKAKEASLHYDRGLKLYDDGNYEAARVEFERAYELAPNYRVLYNIGHCYKQLNDYVAALKALERYLAEGGEAIPKDRRDLVGTEIAELKPRIATVKLVVDVDGAEIAIDDVPVGKSPLTEPLRINPGRRKITATKAGRFPVAKSITVAGSDSVDVSLQLPELPKNDTAVRPVSSSSRLVVPVVGFSVTGALLVSAAFTGRAMIKAHTSEAQTINTPGVQQPDIDDAHKKTTNLALATDILVISALVVGSATLYFTIAGGKKRSEETVTAASPVELKVGLQPGGLAFAGSF